MSDRQVNNSPLERDRSFDTRTIVSQSISIIIHVILVVGIASWIAYSAMREQVIPAEVDVLEFEEPQQARGLPELPTDELDVGEPIEVAEELEDVDPVVDEPLPDIELPVPEIYREQEAPEPVDTQRMAEEIAAIESVLDQLRRNIEESEPGGGERGEDSNSRGQRNKRWFLEYSDYYGCDEYARMLKQLGTQLAVVEPMGLVFLDPAGSSAPTRSVADPQNRLCWTYLGGGMHPCDREIVLAAGFSSAYVVQFLSRQREAQLVQLEREYVQSRGMKLEDISRTVFGTRRSASGWEIYVVRIVE